MKDNHNAAPGIRRLPGPGDHLADLLPAFVNGSLDRAARADVRAHLARCATCRGEFEEWVAIGSAERATATPSLLPTPNFIDRVWLEIDRETPVPTRLPTLPARNETFERQERISMLQPTPKTSRHWLSRSIVGGVAAAALAAMVVLTPVGSYAQGFLTVFTPQTVTAVPVSLDAMESLPDLNSYGTFSQGSHAEGTKTPDAAAAGAAAHLTVLTPATLPKGLPATATYQVLPAQTASFTFSAAKAEAAAKAQGKALPPMPANIDGSSVTVSTGAAVMAMYGGPPADSVNKASAKKLKANPESVASMGPVLVIGQTTSPVVTSTGVSTADLEAYLLAQPGIPTDLANAIRSIGDPSTTLPIPIPVSKATSHSVQVQGVEGVSVADSTGLGGGIIWVKNGIVYGIAGSFSENDLLAAANSLH
jgi:hypothetical protein